MSRIAGTTKLAFAAAGIDLADDASPDQLRRVIRRLDDSDELVADRPVEAGVTACYFKIGIADAGFKNANESLSASIGRRNIGEMNLAIFDSQGLHIWSK